MESNAENFEFLVDIQDSTAIKAFTVTIAAPGVVTSSGHGLVTGDSIIVTSTGALPTGLTIGSTYYVIKIDINTFNLATSYANAIAGTKITTSGTQSGTHSFYEAPAYTKTCVMSISHDKGESLDTWFDLCSKFANNEIVGFDPTFGITFKFKKTDPVCQFILAKEYKTGTAATVGIRIVNKLKGTTGKQIDFVGIFSNIAYEPTTETILEVTSDVKVNQGSTFVETDYVA